MTQSKNNTKRTLQEDWALFWRGMKIWNKLMPSFWVYKGMSVLAETFTPYFGLYMSALLVNELAGDCDLHRLLLLAAVTVGGGFLLSLLNRILKGRCTLQDALMWQKHEAFLFDAQNGLQYEHLENPDVLLLRSQIFADMNAIGGGLAQIVWSYPDLLRGVLNILFSMSLTVSMFTMVAEGSYTGFLGLINSPLSALALAVLIAVSAFFTIKIAKTRRRKQDDVRGELAELNTSFSFYVRLWGADLILFNLNRVVMDELRKYHLYPKWVEKLEKVTIRYNILGILLNAVLNIAIFLFVAAKSFIGVFGIGNFILYRGTIERFVNAVSSLTSEISIVRFNNRYLVQLYEYLDLPNKMYQGTLAVEKREDIDYEIEFRDVSFRYPRTEAWALRHVNIKFRIGDKLAIVGENGSGKTTFIKLLCRLYDPTEGKILLNGIDITRYRYDEYLSLFSAVFQDYTLFDFPLGEVVSSGLEYDEQRVRDCLIRAELGEKLADLDADAGKTGKDALSRAIGRDYDSEGIDFSGGERQKIALARALYKDAPFVILDEPTAALDPIAEAAVYENFNRIAQNKTSVFISHRLSSCRFCDSIAVFDHGQLVQMGTHEDLVSDTEGKYSQLWSAQAQYYQKQ